MARFLLLWLQNFGSCVGDDGVAGSEGGGIDRNAEDEDQDWRQGRGIQ